MTQSTVRTNIYKTSDVHHAFSAKSALDLILRFKNAPNGANLFFSEVPNFFIGTYIDFYQHFASTGATQSKNVCKTYFRLLVIWNINASNTSQSAPPLTLSLFMLRVLTDYIYPSFSFNNFTVFTYFFY